MNVPSTQRDDDIDQVLGDAGRRWRAAQPEPTQPDAGLFAAGRAPAGASWASRRWAPAAAIVGLAAVIAAVVVPLSLQRPTEPQRVHPGPTRDRTLATLPPDNSAGVRVKGNGTLFRDGDGPIKLCAKVGVSFDVNGNFARCDRVAVPTTGVDPVQLDTIRPLYAMSKPVRVEGIYHDGTLAVNRIIAAGPLSSRRFVEPAVPCPTPEGGWLPGDGVPAGDYGPSDAGYPTERLASFVRSHPGRYTDIWEGHPDGEGASYAETTKVMVVGTTGDVAQARAEFAAIFPGNLCVHNVKYADAYLKGIVSLLRAVETTPIEATVDWTVNKVSVTVVALDPPTMAILNDFDRDALLIEDPLLQGLD